MGCNTSQKSKTVDISALADHDPEKYDMLQKQFGHFLSMKYPDRDLNEYQISTITEDKQQVVALFENRVGQQLTVELAKNCGGCKGCH